MGRCRTADWGGEQPSVPRTANRKDAPIIAFQTAPAPAPKQSCGRRPGGCDGWEADRRLRMRNAEWLTLTLIEATLVEATLVWITHRLRRFANVR